MEVGAGLGGRELRGGVAGLVTVVGQLGTALAAGAGLRLMAVI